MTFPVTSRAGFSLVEVTLAIGVMSFCLVGLFGLLPIGLTSNQAAVEQTTAANIAASIAADLQAAQCTSGTSAAYQFNMKAAANTVQTLFFGEDANPTGAINMDASSGQTSRGTSHYRASVCLFPQPAGQKKAIPVRILVTWPALADPTGTGWPKRFAGSFEATIALNRN